MKNALVIALVALGLAAFNADAAKRMGGGSNLGKQRPAPTQKEAAPAAAPTTPASPAQGAAPAKPAAPAATPAAPAPKPSFMQRWGGMLAGLAIGAALMSLFGGGAFGAIMTTLLIGLAIAAIVFLALRFFASRGKPSPQAATPQGQPMAFERAPEEQPAASAAPAASDRPRFEIGSALTGSVSKAEVDAAPAPQAAGIPGFEKEPFLRVAKTSFIRLQAANDAGDLDDIRDFTTPELFAEIAMQARERGDAPQKTEVVTLNASLVEAVVEGDYAIASVRFTGLIREQADGNPEPFDEVWHVRKDQRDRKATWLIAGIQQVS
jgi:predicted lipid-binding transport protein (Tim44 family)